MGPAAYGGAAAVGFNFDPRFARGFSLHELHAAAAAATRCLAFAVRASHWNGLKLHAPWHFLYFLPLPQGQRSLRPTFAPSRTTGVPFGASSWS